MRIAVTSAGTALNDAVDARFGRARYFLLIEGDTMAFDVVENEQSLELAQGAGIQAAQNILKHRPDVVITGNCGPKAFRALKAAGIDVVVGATGKILDAVNAYMRGELTPASDANVEGHWM